MMASKQTSPAWPKGVVARYLAVAGAIVDITENPETHSTVGACNGCPSSMSFGWTYVSGSHRDGTYRETQRPEKAMQKACSWGQMHAEKCRAVPQPDGGAR